jgi:hypothetical protein
MKQQIIDNAVAHGVSRDAVQSYIDTLFKIPASVPPTKIDVDKQEADAKLLELRLAFASISKQQVEVNVIAPNLLDMQRQFQSAFGNATQDIFVNTANGTTHLGVLKYADGGTVEGAGTSKSDSIVARLSKGEEVIQEPYASQFRPLLKAINNGNFKTMPAASAPATNSGPSVYAPITVNPSPAMDETAVAIATARQLKARVA